MKFIAVDWSGALTAWRNKLWLAEAARGELLQLQSGLSRDVLIQRLVEAAKHDPQIVVGMDFAFSAPAWFLQEKGAKSAEALWQLAALESEAWLASRADPFWGWKGSKRPNLAAHFRQAETALSPVQGIAAKSVFQVMGGGSVGTGSIRGWPYLHQLSKAGFSIWPFDRPAYPLVFEIFPRLLTGPVVKTRRASREAYLDARYPNLRAEHRETMASSDDAFDAGVSALVMADTFTGLECLACPAGDLWSLEGAIWQPPLLP